MGAGGHRAAHGLVDVPGRGGYAVAQRRLGSPATRARSQHKPCLPIPGNRIYKGMAILAVHDGTAGALIMYYSQGVRRALLGDQGVPGTACTQTP